MGTQENGTRSDSFAEKKGRAYLSSRVSFYNALGKFFEVLSVVAFTGLLAVFWLPSVRSQIIVAAVMVLVAVGLFLAAVEFKVRATRATRSLAGTFEREASSKTHIISDARIRTLIEEGVPADVVTYLRTLVPPAPQRFPKPGSNGNSEISLNMSVWETTTDELLLCLDRELGPDRTKEIQHKVLKYTRKSSQPTAN